MGKTTGNGRLGAENGIIALLEQPIPQYLGYGMWKMLITCTSYPIKEKPVVEFSPMTPEFSGEGSRDNALRDTRSL